MRKLYLIAAAVLLGFTACTDFEREVESDVLAVVETGERRIDHNGGTITVEVKSGSKWDVTAPDWMRLGNIRPSDTPFQWKIDVTCPPNTGEMRSGTLVFTAGSRSARTTIMQEGKPIVEVTNVLILDGDVSLKVGGTCQLTAVVYPEDATDKSVVWSSSNANVVSVSSKGLATALKAGSATITASAGNNKKDQCVITVVVPVSGVSLSVSAFTMTEGDFATFGVTVSPSNATDKTVTWTSSDTTVATVGDDGRVVAKKQGETIITVRTNDGGYTAQCKVTVIAKKIYVKSISVSPTEATLQPTEQVQLNVQFDPSNASDQTVSWNSSSPSVASVNDAGLVTAKSVGETTITVRSTDGGKTASSVITVAYPDITVTLSQTTLTMHPGETKSLTATVTPDNVKDKSVTWSSTNTSVATVSSSGTVSAKAKGTTTIVATSKADNSKKAECQVTVGNQPTAMSVSSDYVRIGIYGVAVLYVSLTPDDIADDSITWTITNSSVASISQPSNDMLTVTGMQNGSATLTVKSVDNPSLSAKVSIKVSGSAIIPEMVDLGLSVKWADANVGSPVRGDQGSMFAWGETTTKSTYSWQTYKWANGSETSLTKYNYDSQYGAVDNLYELNPEDDAATKAYGGNWRMPTAEELYELINGCNWEWINTLGFTGYKVSAKNSNNCIYIPIDPNYNIGYFWTSDLYTPPTLAYCRGFDDSVYTLYRFNRYYDLPVRPVYGARAIPVTGVSLDRTYLELNTGQAFQLNATVVPSNASNQNVTWSSDDSSIASVDQTGLVQARKEGHTVIRVKTEDGGYEAACNISVSGGYDYNYEWFLGTWTVSRGSTVDYWYISPNEYGSSYLIRGIDGEYDIYVEATYDASGPAFLLNSHKDFTTDIVTHSADNKQYYASVSLYGFVTISGTVYYVTGDYTILGGFQGSSDYSMILYPASVVLSEGTFTLETFGYIHQYTVGGQGWIKKNYYRTELPLSNVGRYSWSYAPSQSGKKQPEKNERIEMKRVSEYSAKPGTNCQVLKRP